MGVDNLLPGHFELPHVLDLAVRNDNDNDDSNAQDKYDVDNNDNDDIDKRFWGLTTFSMIMLGFLMSLILQSTTSIFSQTRG